MKKTLGFTLLVVMGWLYYQTTLIKQATVPPVVELPAVEPVPAAAELDYQPVTAPPNALPKPQSPIQTTRQSARFVCDGRQYCSQMTSRAEAEYFLEHCPNTKMDGDNDGIPCENDSRF